jgi:hypothetical protein
MDKAAEAAQAGGVDETDVIEAMIVLAIQKVAKSRGGEHARSFLDYEMSSIRAGGVHEIQRR